MCCFNRSLLQWGLSQCRSDISRTSWVQPLPRTWKRKRWTLRDSVSITQGAGRADSGIQIIVATSAHIATIQGMPTAAPALCVRCHQRGPCKCKQDRVRQARKDAGKKHPYQRGYGRRWQKARLLFLGKHPTCRECSKQGRLTPASVVDHVIPHRDNMELFWNVDNWQPMCVRCHNRKSALGQ